MPICDSGCGNHSASCNCLHLAARDRQYASFCEVYLTAAMLLWGGHILEVFHAKTTAAGVECFVKKGRRVAIEFSR